MKVKVKKTKAKSGDIVVLKNYFANKEEYYLIIRNNNFYSLVNIENGEVFIDDCSNTTVIDDFIHDADGKLYSGNKAKLILGVK